MKTQLRRHLSDTASYKKRIARDCLFSILRYYKLLSKNTMKTVSEKEERFYQIEDAKIETVEEGSGLSGIRYGMVNDVQGCGTTKLYI